MLTIRSNFRSAGTAANKSLSMASIRSLTFVRSALPWATLSAAGLTSIIVTLALRQVLREGDGDDAAAGADVGDGDWFGGSAALVWERELLGRRRFRISLRRVVDPRLRFGNVDRSDDEELRIGTRDQHVGRDGERQREELAVAHEVRHRFAGGALLDQLAKLRPQFFARGLLERRVQLDPLAAADVGEQHLGVEPRRLGALLFQEVGRPVKEPADSPRCV